MEVRKEDKDRWKGRIKKYNIRNLPISIMLILPAWLISRYQSDVIGDNVRKKLVLMSQQG